MDEDNLDQSAAQLLDRAQSGDEAAVSLLVRRYEPELRRFIRVRLTDPRLRRYLDSVDICQAVLGRFFVGFFAGKFVHRQQRSVFHTVAHHGQERNL